MTDALHVVRGDALPTIAIGAEVGPALEAVRGVKAPARGRALPIEEQGVQSDPTGINARDQAQIPPVADVP